jgi:hypothetical protein
LTREPVAEEMVQLEYRVLRQAEVVRVLIGKEGYKVCFLAKHLHYDGVRSSLRQLMTMGLVEVSQQM